MAYSPKALPAQFLQKLHSCQLSSRVLQGEAVFPSREHSLLDGAGWKTIPGLPVCIGRKQGKSMFGIIRTEKSSWNPFGV